MKGEGFRGRENWGQKKEGGRDDDRMGRDRLGFGLNEVLQIESMAETLVEKSLKPSSLIIAGDGDLFGRDEEINWGKKMAESL